MVTLSGVIPIGILSGIFMGSNRACWIEWVVTASMPEVFIVAYKVYLIVWGMILHLFLDRIRSFLILSIVDIQLWLTIFRHSIRKGCHIFWIGKPLPEEIFVGILANIQRSLLVQRLISKAILQVLPWQSDGPKNLLLWVFKNGVSGRDGSMNIWLWLRNYQQNRHKIRRTSEWLFIISCSSSQRQRFHQTIRHPHTGGDLFL